MFHWRYDLGDNTLTQKTNDGSETYTYTYTYDQLNRPIGRNDSLLGYKTLYEYDDASLRTRMHIQPAGGGADLYDVRYSYDEANRLLSVTDEMAAKTAGYEYFDIGALKTAINPNGITAHRTLDTRYRLDLLEYKKTPTTVLSSLDYSYDIKSNVTQLVRDDTGAGGASKTFTFGYDGISRLTSANYGTETVSYTYDKSGNRLTQVSSVDGTTSYTVATDSNQLTRRSLVPEDTDFATLNYSYDAEGKLTQRSEGTDSDAFTYSFGSQLTQIQKTRAGVVSQTLSYAYDGSGQRVKTTDSGGTRYFLYDGGMPVLELDANKKITTSYLYGADGVVYRRKHNAVAHWHFDEGDGTLAHDVDGGNHGTLGDGDADKTPTWSFGCGLLFDGVDDFVKVPDSDGLDPAVDKMTIAAWVQPHSSQIGPLVKKINKIRGYRVNITGTGALRFGFRRNGRDKTVTSTTTLPLHEWTHVAARYDGAQMRIFINGTIDTATAAVTGTSVGTTAPVWIGGEQNHFHGYLDDISIYDRALSDSEIADLVNDVDKRYEYHHLNALGSNIVSTDDDQNVLARYEYDVFGAIRSETGTSDNTRKFTGKEFDADSNLYYYGARYYDPYIGRFTQRDPIADGVNWYAYVANNPLAFIDPTGLRPVNEVERDALIFTFGEETGTFLAGVIDIVFSPEIRDSNGDSVRGRVLSDTQIELVSDYSSDNVGDLGMFIHESTHIWQRHTGLHRGTSVKPDGNRDYDYTLDQLHSLNFNMEEHALAVQQWFVANYAYTHGLLDQLPAGFAWGEPLHQVLGYSQEAIRDTRDSVKIWVINVHYERLMNQIRDQSLLPPPVTKLGQNFPNPAD